MRISLTFKDRLNEGQADNVFNKLAELGCVHCQATGLGLLRRFKHIDAHSVDDISMSDIYNSIREVIDEDNVFSMILTEHDGHTDFYGNIK